MENQATEDSVLEFLKQSLSESLYIDQSSIDMEKNFIEIGLDSILAIEWIKNINKNYGTSIPATKLYDYPNLGALSGYIAGELKNNSGDKTVDTAAEIKIPHTFSAPAAAVQNRTLRSKISARNRFAKSDPSNAGNKDERIAIIGMSGRYPGAGNMEEYWRNLSLGINSVKEIPQSRWDINEYFDPKPLTKGKTYCKWLGVLDDVEYFDPIFFNISPAEAIMMDPQHRLFLQEGYRAFEDAGYSPLMLNNKKCGVYLGIMSNDYISVIYKNSSDLSNMTGNSNAIGAARIPYFLNLKGPAIPIDTACSSSMVGTYLASQALAGNEIDMALVGGVTLYLVPESYIGMCMAGMLSPEGQCKTFDNSADGFVPGDGVGAIVLKRLKDAERDHDHIYGVIIGSGINQDGKTNGITAPNVISQIELERNVYTKYKIDPESIGYVEMHGTGTKLGDPIELEALSSVYREKTSLKNYCGIGSVKSNLGHISAASGVASIQKVLLCMQKGKLVPTLNYNTPNEHFNIKDSPFYVNTKLTDWEKRPDSPRRAGVSSFGFSGTNAHIIIEEYSPAGTRNIAEEAGLLNNKVIFILSAKSEGQLKIYAGSMKKYIESQNDINLIDMAYTLQTGRKEMEYRLAFVTDSREHTAGILNDYLSGKSFAGFYTGEVKSKDNLKIFDSDEDAKSLIEIWTGKGKFQKIAEAWVKGYRLNWEQLYRGAKPYRLSLPAYPFARERYWIADGGRKGENLKPAVKVPQVIQAEANGKEKILLIKEWIRKDVKISENKNQKGIIVILGTALTDKLTAGLFEDHEDIKIINAVHGKTRMKNSIKTDYYSESSGDELYQKIKEMKGQSKFLGLIDVTALDQAYERSVKMEAGKIKLLQNLIDNDRNEGYKLQQITHSLNLFKVSSTTLHGARMAGFYRMIGAEYKEIESTTMDSDSSFDEGNDLKWQIENEFLDRNMENLSECCYRDEERYEPRLKIDKENDEIEGIPPDQKFENTDVIIITGGSRGIGAAVAGHFVNRGLKKLVIMGMEELPKPEDWKGIRDNKKILQMQAYVEKGVSVLYYNTVLTDEKAVNKTIKEIHEELGQVTGVCFCAGSVSKDPAFIKKSINDIEKVCEPKIQGMTTLNKALGKDPLKFFVLFSSISSLVPTLSAGYSDYTMANSYMDYYAMNQEGEGKKYFKSIQWPLWSETGMAEAMAGMQSPAYKRTGLLSITTEEGLRFLDILINTGNKVSAPGVIRPRDFNIEDLLKREIVRPDKRAGNNNIKLIRANNTGLDLKASVNQWLDETFMTELKLTGSQIDDDKPFDEYGVDSIIIAQLAQTLQKKVTATIQPSIFLENRNMRELKDYFTANHAEDLQIALGITGSYEKDLPEQEERIVYVDREIRNENEIAVVGISCRFPGAPTKDGYWELLTKGMSSIKPVPKERWTSKGSGKYYGGWVDGIDMFDAEFFRLKDNDAAIMDPQARVMLEESLMAIYDAGYEYKSLAGQKTGVYIGGRSVPNMDLNSVLQANNPILGVGQNYLAANISRFYNFTGPSLVVDTACSSGLTAISLASDSLKNNRIDNAIIGAVNLILNPFAHELFAARNILNKNGEFHIFDKKAGGEVLGEGAGFVMLKRLSDAVRDGNKIYGVIKAIAVNNDGRTLGPGSPNIKAQKQVMQEALLSSGEKIEDVGYIEVNGGGSPIMDSIEIKSISEIYQLGNSGLKTCSIGSIKPNIGHLLLTSGLAGFIRCILSLHNKRIPPFLSATDPADYYDFKSSRILFNRETVNWEIEKGGKRVAVQNSFPDGGTNCHIVMEEFTGRQGYEQKLFSKQAPALNKKSFSLISVDLTIPKKFSGDQTDINFSDFIEKYKKPRDKKPFSSVHNVWEITR